MTRVRRHLSYANVMVTLLMFIVLGGGSAYALSGSNTVFSDDIANGEVRVDDIRQAAVTNDEIANGQVKAPDIGDGEVKAADIGTAEVRGIDVLDANLTGIDIANNSLKGADVDEGSLAGALIPGIGTSPLVKSSGVVTVDDPFDDPTNEYTITPLLSAGPFTITGECQDLGGNSLDGGIRISSSVGTWSVDSDADLGADEVTSPPAQGVRLTTNNDNLPALDVGDYAAATPNKFLAGEVFSGINIMGTDCVFGVTGIG
jgi:hypothetical protein